MSSLARVIRNLLHIIERQAVADPQWRINQIVRFCIADLQFYLDENKE